MERVKKITWKNGANKTYRAVVLHRRIIDSDIESLLGKQLAPRVAVNMPLILVDGDAPGRVSKIQHFKVTRPWHSWIRDVEAIAAIASASLGDVSGWMRLWMTGSTPEQAWMKRCSFGVA